MAIYYNSYDAINADKVGLIGTILILMGYNGNMLINPRNARR